MERVWLALSASATNRRPAPGAKTAGSSSAGVPRGQECVDGAQERLLVALGKSVDLIQASGEAAVFDHTVAFGRDDAEQLIGANAEGDSEPGYDIGVRPELVILVV